MKKITKIAQFLFIGFCCSIIFSQCEKDEEMIPSASFTCEINGTNYDLSSGASYSDESSLIAAGIENINVGISIEKIEVGTFTGGEVGFSIGYFSKYYSAGNLSLSSNSGTSGKLTITNISNGRISGTFECYAKRISSEEAFITIKNGNFSNLIDYKFD